MNSLELPSCLALNFIHRKTHGHSHAHRVAQIHVITETHTLTQTHAGMPTLLGPPVQTFTFLRLGRLMLQRIQLSCIFKHYGSQRDVWE